MVYEEEHCGVKFTWESFEDRPKLERAQRSNLSCDFLWFGICCHKDSEYLLDECIWDDRDEEGNDIEPFCELGLPEEYKKTQERWIHNYRIHHS